MRAMMEMGILTTQGRSKLRNAYKELRKLPIVVIFGGPGKTVSRNTITNMMTGRPFKLNSIESVNALFGQHFKDDSFSLAMPEDYVRYDRGSHDDDDDLEVDEIFRLVQDDTLQRVAETLDVCRTNDIMGLYHRNSTAASFKERVIAAISDAEQYVYVAGRTLRTSLITDDYSPDWLMKALEDAVKREVEVRVLLADCFDKTSFYRQQLRKYFKLEKATHAKLAGRESCVKAIECLGAYQQFRLRLAHHQLTHFIAMTESEAFVEHYTLAGRGGYGLTVEIRAPSKRGTPDHIFESLKHDFMIQYNISNNPADAIELYLERHKEEEVEELLPYYRETASIAESWRASESDPQFPSGAKQVGRNGSAPQGVRHPGSNK